jgi:DUF177 domain-containing protein
MTAKPAPLLLNATELLRQPGSCRRVEVTMPRGEVGLDDARLTGDVAVAVDVESIVDDILVRGHLSVAWRDECRRCLRPLSGVLDVAVEERYAVQSDPAGDAFPISVGQIDLAPMVREEVLLALPDAPLCRSECPGLCPICGADLQEGPCQCDTTVRDERWAILDQLRGDL